MLNEISLSQLKVVLDQAHTALVILGPNANIDQTASAISFYQSLKDLKTEVNICSPEEFSFANLQGQDEIKQKLGNKDLSVSFDYDEASVDKVSYHIDETKGKFYLVVKPKKGYSPLDTKSVSFDYVGAQADVIFLFGVHQYQSLDHLYSNYSEVYDNATVVTVHNFEPEIGDIKLDISGKSCWSETTLSLIEKLGLELNNVAATNLLYAIENATNNLSSFTASADTFESVAKLLRAGARRIHPKKVAQSNPQLSSKKIDIQQEKKTSFELALEKAKIKKNEFDLNSQMEKRLLPKKKKNKSKKVHKDNSQEQNPMRDKDYLPDNLGRRI
ncbi:MAG: hypothetical protein OEX81_03080 [Candidatus Pacebacteria bacterium]|nr:hypothetical protein [Candidatus Paceibacterota bacterium]